MKNFNISKNPRRKSLSYLKKIRQEVSNVWFLTEHKPQTAEIVYLEDLWSLSEGIYSNNSLIMTKFGEV